MAKTLKIELLKQWGNAFLSNTPSDQARERRAVASLLETALMATGNYKGFGYLDKPYIQGITDESRRRYF
jgi:hypothetical protein